MSSWINACLFFKRSLISVRSRSFLEVVNDRFKRYWRNKKGFRRISLEACRFQNGARDGIKKVTYGIYNKHINISNFWHMPSKIPANKFFNILFTKETLLLFLLLRYSISFYQYVYTKITADKALYLNL